MDYETSCDPPKTVAHMEQIVLKNIFFVFYALTEGRLRKTDFKKTDLFNIDKTFRRNL